MACFNRCHSDNQVCQGKTPNDLNVGLFFFVLVFRIIENTQGGTKNFWKTMAFPFQYAKCDGIRHASTGPLSSWDNSIHICFTCGFPLAF